MKLLKHLPTRMLARQRGSILLICVVIAGVGTLGAAAYFSLIQAKADESEQAIKESERQAKRDNSMALAKEIIYRKYVDTPTGPVATEIHTLPGNWGEVRISPFTEAPMTTEAATRLNKTGSVPHESFSTDIAIDIGDGDVFHPFGVEVKTATPLMMREIFTVHEPSIEEAGQIDIKDTRVKGRAMIWIGGSRDTVEISAERVFMVDPLNANDIVLTDLAGNPLKAENFPFMAGTNGKIGTEDRPFYDGRINVVNDEGSSSASYVEIVTTGPPAPVLLDGLVATPFDMSQVSVTPPGGPWPAAVNTVIQQATEAHIRVRMAARAAIDHDVKVKYKHDQIDAATTPSFLDWHSYEKEFDPNNPGALATKLAEALAEVYTDFQTAMTDLGGPVVDPTWFVPPTPPNVPLATDVWWEDGNPYPYGVWANAPMGSDGDGSIHIEIAKSEPVHITDNNRILILEGQPDEASADAAALLDPLLIVQTNSHETDFKLEDIIIRGINKRPLIVAMAQEYDPVEVAWQKAKSNEKGKDKGKGRHTSNRNFRGIAHAPVDVVFDQDFTPNFPVFRVLFELQNTPLEIDTSEVGNDATFLGAVRTDSSFDGLITIDVDPDRTEAMTMNAARYGWLEAYRN